MSARLLEIHDYPTALRTFLRFRGLDIVLARLALGDFGLLIAVKKK